MENGGTEKIGEVVLDYTFYPGEDYYCDGASEDELLSIVQSREPEQYPEEIQKRHSWEILYHLSDLRENIVEWLPIDKKSKVLEVGAGCGAVTGSFARRAGSVTCVELSRKRSLINAYRHKDCGNITIHVGNFQDMEPTLPADYDYVFLIGVFEYAQSYIGSDTPFSDFYKIVKRHVRQGGRIVIAIENKMGLKYWAGCREDHLGAFFSGLEDYPGGGAVRTFTKEGLEGILRECGEEQIHFYYPYPDYKFMTMVYSDRYLPQVGELSNNLRNFDRDRMLLFDEKKVFDMLIRENLFPLFSNSYLVVTGEALPTIYSRFSNDRARHLCIRTDIGQYAGGQKYVRKMAANPAAAEHIRRLCDNYRLFAARFAGSGLSVNRLEEKHTPEGEVYAELEFLEGADTLEKLLDECLVRRDEAGFRALFGRYQKAVEWKAQEGIQDFDLTFPNICVQADQWTVIDYEWTADSLSPADLVRRALFCYTQEDKKRKNDPIVQKIMADMGMDAETAAALQEKETAFQRSVMRQKDGTYRLAVTDVRHLIGNQAVPVQEFFRMPRRRMQIFEDFGEGYTQEHSYYMENTHLDGDRIQAEIVCKPGVKGIRLDPLEEPCLIRILRVCYGGHELTGQQLAKALVTNGETLGEGRKAGHKTEEKDGMHTVLFAHHDPNINVRLDMLSAQGGTDYTAAPSVLVIEAQVALLSERMLEDIQEKIGRKHFWFQR